MVQKAKQQGDFLLVGLHTDEDVSERRGLHLPIMDLHERCLSVLACKYVDEAIIGTHHTYTCCSPHTCMQLVVNDTLMCHASFDVAIVGASRSESRQTFLDAGSAFLLLYQC